jgi:ABC-type hemin transport system ATPase subunit
MTYKNQLFKNICQRKVSSAKNVSLEADSGMVAIISINLNGKSVLRKQNHGNFEK